MNDGSISGLIDILSRNVKPEMQEYLRECINFLHEDEAENMLLFLTAPAIAEILRKYQPTVPPRIFASNLSSMFANRVIVKEGTSDKEETSNPHKVSNEFLAEFLTQFMQKFTDAYKDILEEL